MGHGQGTRDHHANATVSKSKFIVLLFFFYSPPFFPVLRYFSLFTLVLHLF